VRRHSDGDECSAPARSLSASTQRTAREEGAATAAPLARRWRASPLTRTRPRSHEGVEPAQHEPSACGTTVTGTRPLGTAPHRVNAHRDDETGHAAEEDEVHVCAALCGEALEQVLRQLHATQCDATRCSAMQRGVRVGGGHAPRAPRLTLSNDGCGALPSLIVRARTSVCTAASSTRGLSHARVRLRTCGTRASVTSGRSSPP
jgi:hypothetical protein